MKVKGTLVGMLVEIDPDTHGPYLTKENGVSVLCLEILKALCGMMVSSLLFYRKLKKDLQQLGFKVNAYDICLANKMINGKQLAVSWHVVDLKISHKDKKVVDQFIESAIKKHEDSEITKLKPSRGMVHDYLGITLDYSEKGVVKLYMKEHTRKMLEEFKHSAELKDTNKVSTPAADLLFEVNQNCNKLRDNKREEFHTTMTNTLFLCKRSRPDLQPAVLFLCTRVQSPDKDDWKKLLTLLKHLEQTVEDELALGADEGDVLLTRCCPDAAFAVHADMKSHTGNMQTLGRGAANTISSKQKLNTKSSKEAELVAADDSVPLALWTRIFFERTRI